MAEEQGFQSHEGHKLCANNCGFFGSTTTLNMCSKCYTDLRLKEEQEAMAKVAFENTQMGLGLGLGSGHLAVVQLEVPESMKVVKDIDDRPKPLAAISTSQQPNRCMTCRKRVGLVGFKCRCGSTYCGSHRYPEQHGCAFDYKTVGKANPIIKAEKLENFEK